MTSLDTSLYLVQGLGEKNVEPYDELFNEYLRLMNILEVELGLSNLTYKIITDELYRIHLTAEPSYVLNVSKMVKKILEINDLLKLYLDLRDASSVDINNIHIKGYEDLSTGISNIVKGYFGVTQLKRLDGQESNIVISLCNELLEKVKTTPKIIVLGHSYGGAIINRVAVYMSKLISSGKINADDISKIFFLGFGSIYVPLKSRSVELNDSINLINYLSVGDISMKVNRLVNIPSFINFNKILERGEDQKICSFQNDDAENEYVQGNLRWICLFEDNVPKCIVNNKNRSISMFDRTEHEIYDALLETILLYNKSNQSFISDINFFEGWIFDYHPIDTNDLGGKRTRRRKKITRKK